MELREPARPISAASLPAMEGQWCKFSLLSNGSVIPLVGQWRRDRNDFIFMASPDVNDAEDLVSFTLADFSTNDHIIDLFVAREESARSLAEAASAAETLKAMNRELQRSQKSLDQKLREVSHLATMVEQAMEGIAVADLNGYLQFVNKAWARMHGYETGTELTGNHLSIFHTDRQLETEVLPFNEEVKRHGHRTREIGHKRRDGTTFPTEMTVTLLKDEQGIPYALGAFAQDITERKRAEDDLKRSERQFRELFRSQLEGLAVVDTDEIIHYCNPAFAHTFDDRSPREVVGKCLLDYIPQDQRSRVLQQVRDSEAGKPSQCELSIVTGAGHQKSLLVSFSPRFNREGEYVGAFRAVIDITERTRQENARKDLERQLHHARNLEAVGSLAAGIAHEINTPIQFVGDNVRFLSDSFASLFGLISTYGELWRKMEARSSAVTDLTREKLEAEHEADLEYMAEEIPKAVEQTLDGVERVATIVRAMKDFAHKGQNDKSVSNINKMLESTLTVARNELKYVADVVTDFDAELPQVYCRRNDMNQVFLNLLVNAAHAIAGVLGDGSSGKGTITVSTSHTGGEVTIKIADTGTGIPASIREQVFDPFFTTKDVGKGTGQGLSIARSIVVDKHGGTLHFETEEGKGTTFIITLPVADARDGSELEPALAADCRKASSACDAR